MTEQTTEITAYERSVALVKAELTQYKPKQIDTVLGLLQDGNTVPFIARYRKDQTGSLDEVQIREIEERQRYLANFEKRKEEISRLIDEQGKLTPEITAALSKATTLTALEDIYRPYKQKRRTKATIAKEAGLEPFALWLLMTTKDSVEEKAETFINEEKGILTVEDAINGAVDIIAEWISDEAKYRKQLRQFTQKNGVVKSVVKKEELDENKVY